jgi:CRISPR-associated endonuclease/helicase Cas3
MSTVATFEDFYAAVHDRQEPLPWQGRLARLVVEKGWPRAIGVPTGLGKTTCLDIAVWAIAVDAQRPPAQRVHPTRVWYVVNRRLLVDEGAHRARHIADLLATSDDPVIRSVSAALTERSGSLVPLQVSSLHGAVDDPELPGSPAQQAVVCSTVPMFGSRLLFRGYGAARYTRPIETALASVDTLILLDEAHLSQPLEVLVGQLAEADPATVNVLPHPRAHPLLVSLTATGDRSHAPFELGAEDYANAIVHERLTAAKPTELIEATPKTLTATMAEATLSALQGAQRPLGAVVFLNTARRALDLRKLLEPALARGGIDADISLVTGRLRPVDSTEVRSRLFDGETSVRAGRNRDALHRHHVVVATQTLEVGADLDFDVLVTETAGVRALVQRFGRLNRLGDAKAQQCARAVIVHPVGSPPDPLYGDEPAAAWARLTATAGPLDLGPATINDVLGPPTDRRPVAPELLPAHLDEFAKTSTPSVSEAPVHLFFEGFDDDAYARVQVAWRAYLPAEGDRPQLAPPLEGAETVELPLNDLRDFATATGAPLWKLSPDRLHVVALAATDLRPGDQVILPTSAGGYSGEHGFDPESTTPVLDRSDVGGQLLLRPVTIREAVRRRRLALSEASTELLDVGIEAFANPSSTELEALEEVWRTAGERSDDAAAPAADVYRAERLLVALQEGDGDTRPPQRKAARALGAWLVHLGLDVETRVELTDAGDAWILGRRQGRRIQWALPESDEYDDLSVTERTRLGPHLLHVGAAAEKTARALGLSEDLARAVGNAGRLHDLGKAEPRFQQWLGAEDQLLAKSGEKDGLDWRARRKVAGWPAGGRHEALSVRIARALGPEALVLLEPDPELVLHLVASHHGRGRPGLSGVDDGQGCSFRVDVTSLLSDGFEGTGRPGPCTIDGDLSASDWDQPLRFQVVNRRYGRRGTALLEAVLRQADWVVSSIATETGHHG